MAATSGENGRARFTVDADECIGCGLCEERAPENIEVPLDQAVANVYQQPKTDSEELACFEASDYCPTGGLRAEVSEDPSP